MRPDVDATLSQTQVFDGDGARTKLVSQQAVYHENTNTTTTDTKTQYFVTSSVLDAVVTELDQNGAKTNTFVYQGSEVLAWQRKSGTTETVSWEHQDPSSATVRSSGGGAELEPMGGNAGLFKGFVIPPSRSQATLEAAMSYPFFSNRGSSLCTVDRIESPCYMFGLDAVMLRVVTQPTPKPQPVKPVNPTPGLNEFASPYIRQSLGKTRFARYGTGVIEFSSTPNQFAGFFAQSALTLDPIPLTPQEIDTLKQGINKLLDKCEGFVDKALVKLGQLHSDTPPVSNKIKELVGMVGFAYRRYRLGSSTVSGSMVGKNPWVLIGNNSPLIYARTAIHEIMHLSSSRTGDYPWYSDYEVARALQRVLLDEDPKSETAARFKAWEKDDPRNPFSGYIDRVLREKCEP